MREILFRGKCADTGKWYQGQYIHLHKTTYCIKEDYDKDKNNDIHQIVFEKMTDWGLPNQHLRVDVVPETVGQYTGLTDKNGKKIFEGDIVITKTTSYEFVGCILYSTEYIRFVCMTKSKIPYPMDSTFEYIVIGNIYDNPELLKEAEQE